MVSLTNGVKASFTIEFKTCFTPITLSHTKNRHQITTGHTHSHIKMFSYGLVASTNTTRNTEIRLPAFRIWTLPAKSHYSFWTRKKKIMGRNGVQSIVNLFIYSGLLGENGRSVGLVGRNSALFIEVMSMLVGLCLAIWCVHGAICTWTSQTFLYRKKTIFFDRSAFETFDKRRLAGLLIGRNISFLFWNGITVRGNN